MEAASGRRAVKTWEKGVGVGKRCETARRVVRRRKPARMIFLRETHKTKSVPWHAVRRDDHSNMFFSVGTHAAACFICSLPPSLAASSGTRAIQAESRSSKFPAVVSDFGGFARAGTSPPAGPPVDFLVI